MSFSGSILIVIDIVIQTKEVCNSKLSQMHTLLSDNIAILQKIHQLCCSPN